jgi:hypothetical protein
MAPMQTQISTLKRCPLTGRGTPVAHPADVGRWSCMTHAYGGGSGPIESGGCGAPFSPVPPCSQTPPSGRPLKHSSSSQSWFPRPQPSLLLTLLSARLSLSPRLYGRPTALWRIPRQPIPCCKLDKSSALPHFPDTPESPCMYRMPPSGDSIYVPNPAAYLNPTPTPRRGNQPSQTYPLSSSTARH